MSYSTTGMGAAGLIDETSCGVSARLAPPGTRGRGGPDASYKIWSDGSRSLKKCCPADTWSNGTIAAIFGANGLRGFNEIRIYSFADEFRQLMRQVDSGALPASSTGLSPSLTERLKKAFDRFEQLFPRGRWAAAPGSVGNKDCTGKSTYSTIVDPQSRPVTPSQAALIASVPGGQSSENVYYRPTFKSLFTFQSGKAAPGPWLSSFLNEFAASPMTSGAAAVNTSVAALLAGRLRKVQSSQNKLVQNIVNATQVSTTSAMKPEGSAVTSSDPILPSSAGAGMSTGAKLALGFGGIVTIGAVAFLLTKR